MGLSKKEREELASDIEAEMLEAHNRQIARVLNASIAKQIGGDHYAKHAIQPWNIIDDWGLDYYLGNVIKYVLRDKHDQVEDLQKAIHYLEKKIELLKESK